MLYRKSKNEKDIKYILKHLRVEDEHECLTQIGKKYRKTLLKDIMESNQYCIIGCDKKTHKPVVVGGVSSVGNGIGVVWMLSTPQVIQNQISLLKELEVEIKKFDKEYWLTYNIIFQENYVAKKWLKKYGYRFPKDEKEKNFTDKQLIKAISIPENFELFYRIRQVRGLN